MAYKRRSYAGRKTYYKRGKMSRSVRAITTSRAFKASAMNMTQNGKFNVNVRTTIGLSWGGSELTPVQFAFNDLDIPALLAASDMHRQLSNVFDQYKIEKATVKILPNIGPAAPTNATSYISFFSVVDRTGFNSPTIDQLRSYGSYKETNWSWNDSPAPHMVYIGQSDVVSKSTYYDTKSTAVFPKVKVGGDLGASQTTSLAWTFSVEIDAQVRYRGVRLDTSSVSTRLPTNSF